MAKKNDDESNAKIEISQEVDEFSDLYAVVLELETAQSLSPGIADLWKPLLELVQRQRESIKYLEHRLGELEGQSSGRIKMSGAEIQRKSELDAIVARSRITTFFGA